METKDNEALLKINNLSIEYINNGIKFPGIDKLSLILKKGEILGIAGESGSGKTSLCKAIVGLVSGDIKGRIIFEGKNILKNSNKEWKTLRSNKISYCYSSSIEVLNPSYTIIKHMIELILESKDISKKEAIKYSRALLIKCGLEEAKHCLYPGQLSGGEIQRALIALAMVNDPEILIFDEPTTGLDSNTKYEMINLLKKILITKTVIIVSHDLTFLKRLSDKIAILYSGRIIEKANCKEFFINQGHPYSRKLYNSHKSMIDGRQMIEIRGDMYNSRLKRKGCVFYERCTQSLDICRQKVPELKKYNNRFIACHRGGIVDLLKLKNINKSYPVKTGIFNKKHKKILKNINLYIESGELVALVGESGAGKTTIGQIIAGIIDYDGGEIIFDKTIKQSDVQYIFQDYRSSFSPRFTVVEAIREPLDIKKEICLEKRNKKSNEMLSAVGLSADLFANKYCYQLSDGELQRIAFARALITMPGMLIADESISKLDSSEMVRLIKLLLNLQNKYGIGILFITHNLKLARKISRRIYVLHKGEIIEEGYTENILLNPSKNYSKKLIEKEFISSL